MYIGKSVTNRLLKSRLHDLRLEEGGSLKAHLDEFCTIVMDLHNIDVVVDDEDLAIFLLCSLPSSYKNFRKTMLYGRENLSSNDVKNTLIQRDLIEKQLTQKHIRSNERLFVRRRMSDNSLGGKELG